MLTVDSLGLLRRELNDVALPTLWSDDDLYTYLDDAQKMFCRLTDGIADSSNAAVTKLNFAIGAAWLPLHPSILKIRSGYLVSSGLDINIINREDMPNLRLLFDGGAGPVTRLIIGMEENRARTHPVASIADAIQLSVFRLPIDTIAAGGSVEYEIADQHHRHLFLWAKHLAYSKQDSQTVDRAKDVQFEEAFHTYCEKVALEQQNKRHKLRSVSYGGI